MALGKGHLIIDATAARCFSTRFPEQHFRIAHNLSGHPLFERERLIELARALPRSCIEYNAGNLSVSQDPKKTPGNGLDIEQTIERIADCDSWVALKYVERDRDYRQLLIDCVQEIAPFSEERASGTRQLEAYIFISSPGSVTPFHFDDEHNFLLQLVGSKDVHAWEKEVLSALEVERFYGGAHRNVVYRSELDGSCQRFGLRPGDGLHIPVHSPHWVKNGPEVSVSFSVTFRSAALAREAAVHRLNAKLRRRGWPVSPYGRSRFGDSAKHFVARALRRAKRGIA